MHTILWFLYFWLYLIAVLPLYWYLRRLEKRGDRERCDPILHRTVGRWARRLIRAAGAKVTVEGLDKLPAGPAVYVANHQGYFDIPVVLGYLGDDTKPLVAKKEIDRIPLIRRWMRLLHCVFLDRENPPQCGRLAERGRRLGGTGLLDGHLPRGHPATRAKRAARASSRPVPSALPSRRGCPWCRWPSPARGTCLRATACGPRPAISGCASCPPSRPQA